MWEAKKFKTSESMHKWIDTKGHLYQWHEVFINNWYAIEYRKLVRIY